MHTIQFTWDDGHHSSESFKDNGEFYAYMDRMKEDGHFPQKMQTTSSDMMMDGYDARDGNWIEIETVW